MKSKVKRQIEALSGGAALFDEPLAKWTSLKLGGPADVIVMPPEAGSLAKILDLVREEGIPYFIMGRGTNLIARDGGFRGAIISLRGGFNKIKSERQGNSVLLTIEGGVYLPRIIRFTAKAGLSGLEFAAGIPGSVGGAIAMNAGSWGGEMKDRLDSITTLDPDGKVSRRERGGLSFGYRSLSLPQGSVILSGTVTLEAGDPVRVASKVSLNLERKRSTQPLRVPSAGSVFKNPSGTAAGKLIELAGLKGTKYGKATISKKHANFIVNMGGAKASDVLGLLNLVQERVYERFKVSLETEVQVIGENL